MINLWLAFDFFSRINLVIIVKEEYEEFVI